MRRAHLYANLLAPLIVLPFSLKLYELMTHGFYRSDVLIVVNLTLWAAALLFSEAFHSNIYICFSIGSCAIWQLNLSIWLFIVFRKAARRRLQRQKPKDDTKYTGRSALHNRRCEAADKWRWTHCSRKLHSAFSPITYCNFERLSSSCWKFVLHLLNRNIRVRLSHAAWWWQYII